MKRMSKIIVGLVLIFSTNTTVSGQEVSIPACIAVLEMVAKSEGIYDENFERGHEILKQHYLQRGRFDEESWESKYYGGFLGFRLLLEHNPQKAIAHENTCGEIIAAATREVRADYR